ncbi:nucleoside triphosphate pyrophosphohydrolase [Nocardioides sp. GY 10127]|nr:nucleoside triphosphate pyrophosphohydrolase [Nocardioides sp. GY 10127]
MTGVMARLRAECPWKAEQTPASLRRYLLEEAHETLEALDALAAGRTDAAAWAHLREELGDLLLQVYFHAAIAAEQPPGAGRFDIEDVAHGLVEKMLRRNPHVFGPDPAAGTDGPRTAAEVDAEWQRIKAAEKSERRAPTDGVPASLPALLWAEKVLGRLEPQDRAAAVPTPADPQERLGEDLLALVERARAEGLDAELALRDAVRRRLPEGPAAR